MKHLKNKSKLFVVPALLCVVWSIIGCRIYSAKNVQSFEQLRVLSYNIHHANPPSKKDLIDIDAIANVITESDADVVALQEVDQFTKRSANTNQAKLLAEKTQLKYFHFFKAIDYDGGNYGLAILSRFPFDATNLMPLEQKEMAEKRILATVKLSLNGKQFIFANTHLDATKSPENRNVQMQQILKVFENETLPVILCGDLNSIAGADAIKLLDTQFKRSCLQNCAGTIPQINPNKTIDYIAVKNWLWPLLTHQVIAETYASDHRPLLATFNLKP